MVGDDGRVCVTDFGLARLQPELAHEFATSSMDTSVDPMMSPGMLAETLATQTRTGAMVGTPAYMSPEQWRGQIADARSDQFSFCVALYEALFDARPFAGRTAAELSAEVCEGNPKFASASHVPRWVVRVVRRGFSRVPDARYADMDALLTALTDTPRRRRRRRITGMLAAGFVAVGAGAYGLARLPAQAGCTEPDRLVALWDPAAQAEVAAVLGDEIAATDADVSAWIDAWRAAQREVCSHIDDPTRSVAAHASLECLDRRLSSMHAALAVMRESGSAGAALASVIETMPSPAECTDAGKWLTIQPDHHTPMGRVLAATLAEDVDRIEALRYAGRHDEAVAIAIAVLAQAEIDGDHAVRAMALAALGQLHSAHKDAELAHTTLRAAAWAAEASGHVAIAVDAWTELAAVVGGQLERYEDGLAAVERAEAALFRLRDPARALTLASNEAMLHSMAGRYDLAHARQVEVLARATQLYGPRHRQVARVHMNVAAVLIHLGRLDEATSHAQSGIEIQREHYPGAHPVTAEMLSTLGVLEIQRGNEAAARVALDEALGMLDETTDASRATRANVLSNRAALDIGRGDGKAAIEGYREVLALRRASSGPAHADIAMALHNLAHAHDKAGDAETAIATYRESLAMRLVTNGPDHPSTGNTLHNLGALLVKEADVDEGMTMLERALELRERANVDPWRRASTRYAMAKGYERRGDRKGALAQIQHARTLLTGVGPRGAELATAIDTWVAALPDAGR